MRSSERPPSEHSSSRGGGWWCDRAPARWEWERDCVPRVVWAGPKDLSGGRCLPKAGGAGKLSIQRGGPAPRSGKVVRIADGRGTETLERSLSKSTSRFPGFCEACCLSGVSRPHNLVPVGVAPHNLQTHGHWSEDRHPFPAPVLRPLGRRGGPRSEQPLGRCSSARRYL